MKLECPHCNGFGYLGLDFSSYRRCETCHHTGKVNFIEWLRGKYAIGAESRRVRRINQRYG